MNTPLIRASERRTFKRCQARWWWSYREGLRLKSQPLGPLWFGTGIHIALAAWHCGPGLKRGAEPVETWEDFARGALAFVKTTDPADETIAKYENAANLGRVMLEGYRALYGRDEHMHIIAPERTFRLDLPWPTQKFWDVPSGSTIATHVGTFDRVYRDLRSGRMWLGENKTAGNLGVEHLSIDDQAGTYWAVATTTLQREGLLKPKEFIAGIMYDILRKGLPDDRPCDAQGYYCNKPLKADYTAALEAAGVKPGPGLSSLDRLTLKALAELADDRNIVVLGERSKIQPPGLFLRHEVHRTTSERRSQMLRLQQDALQMELFRDGLLPVSKNTTFTCHRECEFFPICELQERGGDWQTLRDAAYRVEDPYADHRKSTDE